MAKQRTDNTKVRLNRHIYELSRREAEELDLTHKDYAEAAVQFFATRKLNPKNYQAGMAFDLAQRIDQGVDRLFRFLKTQERFYLDTLAEEVARNGILAELVLENMHKLSELSKEEYATLQAQNRAYYAARMNEIKGEKAERINNGKAKTHVHQDH